MVNSPPVFIWLTCQRSASGRGHTIGLLAKPALPLQHTAAPHYLQPVLPGCGCAFCGKGGRDGRWGERLWLDSCKVLPHGLQQFFGALTSGEPRREDGELPHRPLWSVRHSVSCLPEDARGTVARHLPPWDADRRLCSAANGLSRPSQPRGSLTLGLAASLPNASERGLTTHTLT